jgi:hypothetical protein
MMKHVAIVNIASVDEDLELSQRIKGKGGGDACAQQVRNRAPHF